MTEWVKASASYGNGECVEVKKSHETIWVRNSKYPGVTLGFTLDEWAAFLSGVRAGEFHDMVDLG